MKHITIKYLLIFATLSIVFFISGCSTSGGGYSSVSYGVYGGYRYPYDRHYYGGGCCYQRPDRPDRPNRPERPNRPGGPSHLPAPGTVRPGIKPIRPGSMGRPSGISRPSRGGGGRGRR